MAPFVVDAHIESYCKVSLADPILFDVSWQIRRGQHWALVGENGSGKSSLLGIIAGDIWPTRGVVRVLGHEYGRVDKRELKKRIGVVSANLYATIPGYDTGLEVAASGIRAMIGRLGPFDDDELVRARLALARVSATSVADKITCVMSQGERQRVVIARALVNEPDLLILDEPSSGLDPVARERLLEDLGRLAEEPEGPTQLHVTHHLEEIPPFVSHALLLKRGRIIASGPVISVITSENLTAVFGEPCEVTITGAAKTRRFELRVAARRSS